MAVLEGITGVINSPSYLMRTRMNQFCLGKTLGEMRWRMTVSVEKVKIIFPVQTVVVVVVVVVVLGPQADDRLQSQVENVQCWLKNVNHLGRQF